MFLLVPGLFVWYLIDKDIIKLYAAVGFAWFWMIFAIIRLGQFREIYETNRMEKEAEEAQRNAL